MNTLGAIASQIARSHHKSFKRLLLNLALAQPTLAQTDLGSNRPWFKPTLAQTVVVVQEGQ